MNRHRLTFVPADRSGTFEEGIALREAALELGLFIESTCAGLGTCAKCKVQVRNGVSAPTTVEQQLLSPQQLDSGIRLSCQTRLTGPCACVIPPESIPRGAVILTEGTGVAYPFFPDVRKYHLQLKEPEMGDRVFDSASLIDALKGRSIDVASLSMEAARTIAPHLREHDWSVTAVVHGGQVAGVEPADTTESLFGAALDIGTTTLAATLIDLAHDRVVGIATAMNPQRRYGADVVSRIQYGMEHPGGVALLHKLIVGQINDLLTDLYDQASITPHDCWRVVVAGNTVMQHFFLNIDPRNVAHHPYVPPFQGPASLRPHELGLTLNPAGSVYVLPNIASFVGADITAVLTALRPETHPGTFLVVDIGTNGEMVLGTESRMLCCSSPAGPAWEGASIAFGMRAAAGAIERAEIMEGDLRYRTIGNEPAIGICGSGLLDLVCEFLRARMIDPTGRILGRDEIPSSVSQQLSDRVVDDPNGTHHLRIAPIANDQWVILTQKDIREVQLAKAAIAAGIRVLMNEMKVDADAIDHVYIAGAFGNHVRPQDAIDCGLIPPVPADRVVFIGNAALTGAASVLRSADAREAAEKMAGLVGYVEISARTDFQDLFVEAMHFPSRPAGDQTSQ